MMGSGFQGARHRRAQHDSADEIDVHGLVWAMEAPP